MRDGATCEATKQNAPLCAFCWPRLVVAVTMDYATELPRCARCAANVDPTPKVPRFMWRDLKEAARAAFHPERETAH